MRPCLRIGLVGGYGHCSVIRHPDAAFAFAMDGFDTAASRQAERLGIPDVFDRVEDMLGDFQPHVVYVGTAFGRNGELTLEMARRGFPVVCEKPMATDWKTLAVLKDLRASGKAACVAEFTMRWNAAVRLTREQVLQGEIGDPVHVQAQKSYRFGSRPAFYKKRGTFGGIIPWVAIHAIDYASWCTGLGYETVLAHHGNRAHPEYEEMEDYATMLLKMDGGVPCVVSADFLRPQGAPSHGDDRLRITGTQGVVEMRNREVWCIGKSGARHWECPPTEAEGVSAAADLVGASLGNPVESITPEACLAATAAALAARDAADLGSPQAIPR